MKHHKTCTSIIIIFIIILSLFRFNQFNMKSDNENQLNQTNLGLVPHSSNYWYNFTYIHINGNWSTATGYDWCYGDGSWSNPYIIENMTINASSSPTGSGIIIENSINYYFIIRNVSIFNAGTNDQDASIKLINSNNGQILKNILSNNGAVGLYLLSNCINNTIKDNLVSQNNKWGVVLNLQCNNNHIEFNEITDNTWMGLSIYDHSNRNFVHMNNITNSLSSEGISISFNSHNNTINQNLIRGNDDGGIVIYFYSHNNNIINNIINNNGGQGIDINTDANNSVIFNNTISNHIFGGVWIDSTSGNSTVFMNTFLNNVGDGYDEGENNQWDNDTRGNYWDDYTGIDDNDDGIGDTPFSISGGGSQDRYPLWWDPPKLEVYNPSAYDLFSTNAPTFNYSILEGIENTTWYELEGSSQKYFFSSNGTINQTAWLSLLDGSIDITFYANDSKGVLSFILVTTIKDTQIPKFIEIFPPDGNIYTSNPSIYFTLDEPNLNSTWYRVWDGNVWSSNYFFIGNSLNLDQNLWDSLPLGTITIRLYINDTLGHFNYKDIQIIKDVPKNNPTISFGNIFIIITMSCFFSLILYISKKNSEF